MKLKAQEMAIQNIDHLGIVAGIIDSFLISRNNQRINRSTRRRKSKSRSCGKSYDSERVRICI